MADSGGTGSAQASVGGRRNPEPGGVAEARPLVLSAASNLRGGGRISVLELAGGRPLTVGRSSDTDWKLPAQAKDLSVSRYHATLTPAGSDWYLEDGVRREGQHIPSKHGTFLGGRPLAPGERLPLRAGDEVSFGRFECHCHRRGEEPAPHTTAFIARSESVSRVPRESLAGVQRARLEAIIAVSAELNQARSTDQIAEAIARSAVGGTGCRRAMVVRLMGDGYRVMAGEGGGDPEISRTLLDEAARAGVAQLDGDSEDAPIAESVQRLNIRSALCALMPVEGVEGEPSWFLYLDARGSESQVPADAGAFCAALAQFGGQAIDRLRKADMADRRRQMERDLDAARQAQIALMPERAGRFGGVCYAFESRPGRLVSGDLIDVFPIDGGRTAFFVGDVEGKGAGAGVLMAAAQSQLRTLLSRGVGLADSLGELNRHLIDRYWRWAPESSRRFMTLVAGIVAPSRGIVELADAGHGLCFVRPARGPVHQVSACGPPITVLQEAGYRPAEFAFVPGDRLTVFTDGVKEQRDADRREFGIERALAELAEAGSVTEEVARLTSAVLEHAQTALSDDLTVLSLEAISA